MGEAGQVVRTFGWFSGMDTASSFTAVLQLPDPWRVSGVEFLDDADGRCELHITIGFRPGLRFHCPEVGCGEHRARFATRGSVWHHPDFFPVQGVYTRQSAARVMPGARRQGGSGAVGASGQRRPRSCSRR